MWNFILTTDRDAVVAPVASVQTGQDGPFVYVIKPDLTVEARKVSLSRTTEHDAVIREGLKGGRRSSSMGRAASGRAARWTSRPGWPGRVRRAFRSRLPRNPL